MFKSIQWKILTMFLLLTVSVMIFVGAFSVRGVSRYYHDQFATDMRKNTFTNDVLIQLDDAAESSVSQLCDLLRLYSVRLGVDTYRNVYVLDAKSGACLSTLSGDVLPENIEITPNIISAMSGEIGNNVNNQAEIMDYAVPVHVSGSVKYIVYVVDTKVDMYDIMQNILGNILGALAIGMGLAVILGFILSKTIISPIVSLQTSARHLAEGNFDDIIKVDGTDEIGSLTQSFNDMATELKNTIEDVIEEKSKNEIILFYMTDGVMAFNLDGNLMHLNPAAERILDTTSDKITSFDEFFKSIDLDVTLGQFLYVENATAEHKVTVGKRHVNAFFAPLISEGHNCGVVVVLQDTTEQQKLDASRREFVANVSHELRTPLTTIKSYTQTLMSAMDEGSAESGFLAVIDSEADRMTRLVKDLLTLSRLDNKVSKQMTELSLSSVIRDVTRKLTMQVKAHKHKLVVSVADKLPLVQGDRDRLEQVVTNLLTNAIKYTPDGGKIELYCNHQGSFVYLRVCDNGIGIPSADLSRIFERFYRVDKARSRELGGTGLGLAITKEIIEAHNGKITIESVEGKGTTVTVLFPAIEPDDAPSNC